MNFNQHLDAVSAPQRARLRVRAICMAIATWALLFSSINATAGLTIEAWRAEATLVKALAENDAPLAYRQARQLETTLPLDASPSDKALVNNLLARIETYLALTQSASAHASQALRLASEHGDRIGQVEAELNIALNAEDQESIEPLEGSTTRAVSLLDGVERPDLLVESLLRTSTMYRRIGQLDESVTMAMQALEVARRSNNALTQAYAYQGLGIAYEQSDHKDKAIEHFQRMAQFAKQGHSKLLEAYALTSLARATMRPESPKGDESHVKEAISLFRTVGAPLGLAYGLFNWAEIMRAQKQYSAALRGYTEVLAIYERYPNRIGQVETLTARSAAYQAMSNFPAAFEDAERASEISRELALPSYRSNSAQRLSELAAVTGDFKRAYALAQEAAKLSLRGNQQKINSRVVQLAQRFETESKRRQIEELTRQTERQSVQQRWLWTVLFGSISMLAGSTYFMIRIRKAHRLQEKVNSELQKSRSALEKQTNILQSILNSIGDGVVVADQAGHLVLVNPAARKIMGDLQCSPYLEAKVIGTQEPRNPLLTNLPLARAIRGESCDMEELLIQTANSSSSQWLSVTARPLLSKDGLIQGGVAVFSDITAHKNAAELLKKSEREFRTLAENSPDVIVRYDSELRRVYTNPAYEATTGVSFDDSSNAGWQHCLTPSFDRYQAAIKSVLCTGTPADLYMEWKHPDGEVRCYAINVVPEMERDDGMVTGALAIGHDITALKQAEKRIEESYAMLQELAAHRESAREEERARIARELHDELGQLLTALRLGVSTLRLQFGATNPLLSERITALTDLADKTLQGMRDVATLLRPPALNMGILAALEWLVEEFSQHTGLSCEFDGPRYKIDLGEARSIALFRLVQESLTNVARHANAQSVHVMLIEREHEYLLEVRDDGQGFDPSIPKRKHFGLAGMRERGALIGGDVVIDSSPGNGTCIRVHIPITEPMEQAS